ncbi:MAG: TonB-dependent receptor [Bacteroidota bacterium]|nr:TonB-dependent receptor [Bacteroidota bacterium]MDP4216528.1 TonB-dependent receptor [Bacteroidota bacterium]MDP4246241.1 TonB-dependent receptor [Bacteroidota bacterium]MDP4254524.1 TonB-dependent receptor [Bacteroidota bacterium]MDP4257449.1 TonB-dependent receptor [Bacteroidota bacterium]
MKGLSGLLLLLYTTVSGQYRVILRITSEDSRQPVWGASVMAKGSNIAGSSDSLGLVRMEGMAQGSYNFLVTCAGYADRSIKILVPVPAGDTIAVMLEPDMELLGNVIVSSSRINGRIKDLPTRVEVLGTDDMEEETSMHPGNVAMLLSEASGIQTQQTSASSGNVQIRILGLDGKYTQLLKDGFPMYSGFSSGLSVMQIPPLDLAQVELIKGGASSMYGGDAIAGIINFISKKPGSRPDWNILANQTARGGTDAGSFFTVRNAHWGLTLLNTFTHQIPVDIHNDGFTVLPKLTAFAINPKLFWYPTDSASVSLAVNATVDHRTGGDLLAVKNGPTPAHPYTENNQTGRYYYQLEYTRHAGGGRMFTVRNSTSFFDRKIGIMDYLFSGRQWSTFSEASYLIPWAHHKMVAGMNFLTDRFEAGRRTDSLLRDYSFVTTGFFVQDNWSVGARWALETGIRNDYQSRYGNFLLPRASVLYKLSKEWSLRLGGGLGYKAATIFDAQTEETAYKDVLPIGGTVKAERSAGVNTDFNYTGRLGEDMRISIDQAFFYTRVDHPLVLDSLQPNGSGTKFAYFTNAGEPYTTRGFESSLRVKQDAWSLFTGFTYVDARTGLASLPHIALAPRSKLVFDLSNEKEGDYRIALEAFYTGTQYLYDGSKARDFWTTGLLVEKLIRRVTIVLNFEDLTDTRQTRFGPVVVPPVTNPAFREIYAPMEGFLVNLAVKVKVL